MGQGAMGRCMILCLLPFFADPPCTLQQDINMSFLGRECSISKMQAYSMQSPMLHHQLGTGSWPV